MIQQCGINWRGGYRLISLRRLAYLFNVSLYDVLLFSGDVRSLPLNTLETGELPDHLKIRRKTARSHHRVYQKVVGYLEEQDSPPSLKQVTRFAKVSVGYLEYCFPSLIRKIVESYQSYRKQQALVNRYRAQAAAFRFFTDDGYAVHTQSRKEAYRVLKEETGLPKWVLKDAIQTTYSALARRAVESDLFPSIPAYSG